MILEINNLVKNYKESKAVDGISLKIGKGEIVGLLGPNGAGKTTTINMVLGILEPTSGTIKILDQDIKDHRSKINQQINFAAVYAESPANLSVYQILYIFGLIYEVKDLKKRIEYLLHEFDLEKFRNSKVGLLSSGEQSRLNIAKAIINEPCLILLDEPTASLDPSASQIIREKIKNYVKKTNAGILWTSHNMHEIKIVCDRVFFLSHGKILLDGDPKTLPAQYGKKDLEELFITVTREPLTLESSL
jgi:ABC-2 type transport system ATP-binding protein